MQKISTIEEKKEIRTWDRNMICADESTDGPQYINHYSYYLLCASKAVAKITH